MKVVVAVVGSPSLIVLMISVDVKQHIHSFTHSEAVRAGGLIACSCLPTVAARVVT